MAYRIESGRLDKAQRTPQGGLRVPAAIGRTGCLTYTNADGTKRVEYRSPEEAGKAESLASLRDAPVTDLHPRTLVTPDTWGRVSKGHAAAGELDGEHIKTDLTIQDAMLIRAIESRARQECSAGYTTDLVETPGVAPDGTHYDAIQTNIKYNHVALGPPGWGRAGSTVALRLDSNGDAVPLGESAKETKPMKTERIDGVDYEVGSDSWRQARERHDAKVAADFKAATERADKAEADLAAAIAERDEAKGRADGLAETMSPDALSAAVAARVALQGRALAINPTVKCDGLSDRALMVAALGAEDKDDKVSDDYWRGRFDTAVERAGKADASFVQTVHAAHHADGGGQSSLIEAALVRKVERMKGAN